MAYRPLHQRALIRLAIVRVLQSTEALTQYFGQRIYANRVEHWLQKELPAMGVYTLSESWIDQSRSPDPDERRIDLAIEILDAQSAKTDDRLDAFSLIVEKVLNLDAIGNKMGEIVNEMRAQAELEPIEKELIDGEMRYPIDTLLLLSKPGTELGLAVESERQLGVCVMSFDLEYKTPQEQLDLPDFLLAYSGWDVHEADGVLEMESQVEFEPSVDNEFLSARFMQKK